MAAAILEIRWPLFRLPHFFENAAGWVLSDPAGFVRSHWDPPPRTLAETQALLQHLSRAMQPFSIAEQAWVSEHWLPQLGGRLSRLRQC